MLSCAPAAGCGSARTPLGWELGLAASTVHASCLGTAARG
jgi:hypothetical protein